MGEEIKSIEYLTKKTDRLVALAGNPNAGKSSIFNCLTGLDAFTANYSGKTVDINCGILNSGDMKIGIVDLPGVYSLGATSEEQEIAIKCLFENKFDKIVYVADATNLNRNLYLMLQLTELGLPLVAAVNFSDITSAKGIRTDLKKLTRMTGVRAIETSALRGDGIEELVEDLSKDGPAETSSRKWPCSKRLDSAITSFSNELKGNAEVGAKGVETGNLATVLFERIAYAEELVKGTSIPGLREKIIEKYTSEGGEDIESDIISERYAAAGKITEAVQTREKRRESFSEKLWRLSTYPLTGIPLLLAVFAAVVLILFQGGNMIAECIESLWEAYCSGPVDWLIRLAAGDGITAKVLKWGFNDGLLASLTVGIPYVLIFYLILSFLEDSGYLNAAAFLLDKTLHSVGLHSKAFIPISAAIGCSVPAVMGTRILNTKREKIIAISLIVLIACSARTAVIFSAVSKYIGILWAVSIIIINMLIAAGAGLILNKIVPGEHQGSVMEIFPLRKPKFSTVLKKTWTRFKDFLIIAMPVVIAGSMILGLLYETGYIWSLEKPFAPIFEGWLGLPAFTGLALVFAILRKELALQFLVVLACHHAPGAGDDITAILTPEQIYTFTIFNTIYMPCLATITVMGKEIGAKWTTVILACTLAFSILFSGTVHHAIRLLNLL